MFDPLDIRSRRLADRLERKRRIAALIIALERLSLSLWRPLSWVLFFAALWMFRVLPVLGDAAPIAALAVFWAGLVYFTVRDFRGFRFPSAYDIDRRLEAESGVAHRPLSALKDRLANPQKAETRSLWEIGRTRIAALLPGIKTGAPKPLLAARDPRALRLGVAMMFILGLMVAGPAWKSRIIDGLTPLQFDRGLKAEHDINIWITPPKYTELPQIIVNGGRGGAALKIPVGSELKIRVHSGIGQPVLHVGQRSWPLERSDADDYALEMPMPPGERLYIRQMLLTRAQWDYTIIPDNPPSLRVETEPEPLPGGALRFSAEVLDDYGVENIEMHMALGADVEEPPLGETVSETRSVMSPANTEFTIRPVYDLTAHPWAGLPVVFTFTARDAQGHEAQSEAIALVLPERNFTHPVARALIALRKEMAWTPLGDHTLIARKLEALLSVPESFGGDMIAFLGLRMSASRVLHNVPSETRTREVMALLWDTALRIEDGNLTLAARNLREKQMALENALKNPETSQQEISELMNELREAMAEYFTELQREIQKRIAEGQSMPMVPPELLSHSIDPEALANFLDQLEQQLRAGDRQSAQDMLAQLQRMMDMMDPSMTAPLPMDMQMMSEGINELQELVDRQENLLEQTHSQQKTLSGLRALRPDYGQTLPPDAQILEQWGLDGLPPPPEEPDSGPAPQINTQDNSAEQEALRYILGQLMLEADTALGEIPEGMGLAERAMNDSAKRLAENNPGESIPHQEKALEYLKQAQQQLSQQLMARMQQMTGMSFSAGGMRYDPLGRPYGGEGNEDGMFPGSRVKVPDESERKKAQEILQILRRRAGELERPQEELEYYRRLLRQF